MRRHYLLRHAIIIATLLLGTTAVAAPTATLAATPAVATTVSSTTTLATATTDTTAYVKGLLTAATTSDTNLLGDTLEWLALGYARSGADTTSLATRYLADAATTLKTGTAFGYGRTTDYSRVAVAVTALGGDASNVGGVNLFAKLGDFDTTVYQGINGAIWALIAVDAKPQYSFPTATTGTSTTKQGLIDYILGKEVAGGGWNLYGSAADVDITAMALDALAPYQSQAKVKAAIDRAVAVLSAKQDSNGGYTSYGTANVESVAQAVTALSTLGINPTSAAFTKNGHTLIDNLLSFHVAGSGFAHVLGAGVNNMATEQSYYAIVAYNRFLNHQTALFNMTDVAATPTGAANNDTNKNTDTDQPKAGTPTTDPAPSTDQDETSNHKPASSAADADQTNGTTTATTKAPTNSGKTTRHKVTTPPSRQATLPQLADQVNAWLPLLGFASILTVIAGAFRVGRGGKRGRRNA